MRKVGILAATVAALCFVSPAQATLLNFQLTGKFNVSFQLDSNPVPSDYLNGFGFAVFGVPSSAGLVDVAFYNAAAKGGMALFFLSPPDFYGTDIQLYTGPEATPTLLTGVFKLDGVKSGNHILTVTAIPEPATWAMLIAGLGVVGTAMRRRRTTVSFA